MSDVAAGPHTSPAPAELYGLAAEYETSEQVLAAATAAHKAGYRRMDAYTPYPVEGLDAKLGQPPSRLGFAVLAVGIAALAAGFFMQWFASVEFYPLNVGGRPLNSWPNFIVITFEITVLLSALTAAGVMLARNGLPRLHHSIFNTPGFERASRDRYFLCIESADPTFDAGDTRAFLEHTGALAVTEVER
jgi:hypothetical protein